MYHPCQVSERFYDKNNIPVDQEIEGNQYILNSTIDHVTRLNVLYHQSVLAKKRNLVERAINMRYDSLKKTRRCTIHNQINLDCDKRLIKLIDDETITTFNED